MKKSRAPSERVALVRDLHSRLAELLQTASSILAELHPLTAAAEEGAAESSGLSDSAAISQRAGTSTAQPMLTAAILLPARSAEAAKLEAERSSPMDIPSLRRRLPFIK
ncbi:unnamed protein product [Lampetra planeri]